MKKTLTIIAALTLLPVFALAQAQITTKKVRLSDFPQKIMKVVLTGNPMTDNLLKDEVSARWTLSPYEFCTLEDFEANKTNSDYYFLLETSGQFKKETEPGVSFLTIVKGGKDAEKGIDKMLEACSFPLRSVQMPSGREFTFLPAIVDIMQRYISDSMERDTDAYGGLGVYNLDNRKISKMNVVIAEGDLGEKVTEADKAAAAKAGISFVEDDDADTLMDEEKENTVVSYAVIPANPVKGSYYYKFLIGSGDHRIYYYKKILVGKGEDCGFSASELKRIASIKK